MKIIGWTFYDNPDYPEQVVKTHREDLEIQHIIADELRTKGYRFTGDYHQNGDYGVPVFDDGTVYQCSQRTWGAIMAMAYLDEIDNSDGYGYVRWAWVADQESCYPEKDDYPNIPEEKK